MDQIINAQELRDVLNYDPATGLMTWARDCPWGKYKAGDVAGSNNGKGHIKIMIRRRSYFAHRLAWLHVHGVWPTATIDHINTIGCDNRIDNLREASHAQNQMNRGVSKSNKSGFKGVRLRRGKKWTATIRVNGRNKCLGTFSTADEASMAYSNAAREFHGEFARLS